MTSSSHVMITARAISEKRHVGRPMAPRPPGNDPGPGRRSCRLRSRVMIAKQMIATEMQTRATSTTNAAGLLVGRCRSATGSLPGRYPRNAHAVTNNSVITATARAVDLSKPAIGTPIGWAYPILARVWSLRRRFLDVASRYVAIYRASAIFGGVNNTLQDARVASALDRMYTESAEQFAQLRERSGDFERLAKASAQERADALSEFYLPVTPEAGRLLYALVRATRPSTVVEFGMSLGISAIHLASGVRDNGAGRVVTTELSAAKVTAAKKTFAETGLDDVITVLQGDALTTLASVDGPVQFVLLDGWKELYLPVAELLEPKLSAGALIVADNTSMDDTKPYLEHVRDPGNGYVSVNFPVRGGDSMEISCRAVN